MIKLTKEETKRVIRAAALVESGEETFSCWALEAVDPTYIVGWQGSVLRQLYSMFYEKPQLGCWNGIEYNDATADEMRELRVLMLLTFAEVCGE